MEGRRSTDLLKSSDSRDRLNNNETAANSGSRVAFKPITEERTSQSPSGGGTGARRTRDMDSELRRSKSRERAEFTENVDRMNQNIDHFEHHGSNKIKRRAEKVANSTGLTQKSLFPDKLETLKEANMSLKNHQRDLENEIKIIATKFKRQITLLKKDRLVGGGGAARTSITQKFEQDFNDLIEENNRLQIQEAELMDKVKKLNLRRKKELAKGKSLVSTVPANENQANRHEKEALQVLRNLRNTLEKSNSRVIQLTRDVEAARRMQGGQVDLQDLQRERREVQSNLQLARGRLEDVKSRLKYQSDVFNSGKNYEDSIYNQLKDAQHETSILTSQNRTLKAAASSDEDLKQQVADAKQARDRLQKEFDTIMRQPFFKKESDQSKYQEYEATVNKVVAREKEIAASNQEIDRMVREKAKVEEELEKVEQEKDKMQDDIMKINMHMDPTSLTLNDVMKKLKQEDPSRFREVMSDLEYEGKDPNWLKMNIMDHVAHIKSDVDGLDANSDVAMDRQKMDLIKDKAYLATELAKVQNLLKLQVDIDKQNATLQSAEISQVQAKIKQQTQRSTELTRLIKTQNDKLVTLQNARGPSGLTTGDLQRFNQEVGKLKSENRQVDNRDPDQMTEFSVMTDETELTSTENLLDLRVSSVTFDRAGLGQIINGQDLNSAMLQTFLAVDFYNHDTKSTDLCPGVEPIFNTLFSFKNHVDDFYLKYLEKDSILVDVFYVPKAGKEGSIRAGSSAVKLGSARLPLNKLIEKDFSFQAQEITNPLIRGGQPVGKIFYRMRSRKSLDEALKWYWQKKSVKSQQAVSVGAKQASDAQKMPMQLIEIEVTAAAGLKINGQTTPASASFMKPFFTYDFYSFTHESAVVQGDSPVFQDKKQFEIEASPEFLKYMRQTVLKIDFIDESVEMDQAGVKDYIGSARIPLSELLVKKSLQAEYPITDQLQKSAGRVGVRLAIHDLKAKLEQDGQNSLNDTTRVMHHKRVQQDVVQRIAKSFADKGFDELDLYFDMLFMKDATNRQRVSREMLAEFLLNDECVPGLDRQQLELFMKTHELLMSRQFFTRQELKAIFDRPFQEARFAAAQEASLAPARLPQSYAAGMQHQHWSRQSNPFESPNKVKTGSGDMPTWGAGRASAAAVGGVTDLDDDLARETMGATRGRNTEFGKPSTNTVHFGGENELGGNQANKRNPMSSGSLSVLDAFLKKHVYDVINEFTTQCSEAVQGASKNQFMTAMRKVIAARHTGGEIRDTALAEFFEMYKIGDAFFYRQRLMTLYAKPELSKSTIRRSPAQIQQLGRIKRVFQSYLKKKELSVQQFFAVADKNRDDGLNLEEFSKNTKDVLTQAQQVEMFKAIDADNSGKISLDEIIAELSSIHAALQIEKLNEIVVQNKKKAADFIRTYDNNNSGKIEITEFSEMINDNCETQSATTIDLIFRFVDRQNKGFVTPDDLDKALNRKDDLLTAQMNLSPTDLFLPLATVVKKRLTQSTQAVFDSFAEGTGSSRFITFEGLCSMITFFLGFELSTDEDSMLRAFFEHFTGGQNRMDKNLLEKLLLSQSTLSDKVRTNHSEARATQDKIKRILKLKSVMVFQEMQKEFQTPMEKSASEVNIRNLKLFIAKHTCLPPFEVDNLVRYLDRDFSGFLKISSVQSALSPVS